MRNKSGHITKIILINILIYAIVIIAVELIFGKWLKGDDLNNLQVIKSQRLKIDVTSMYDYPNRLIVYTRDKYGLRGSFDHPGEIDILTMGGSTVNLMYINDGETWQDVIQDRFHDIGKEVIVANAGTEGASTETHLKQFESWLPTIPDLKPKYVIYYLGINDMYLDAYRSRDQMQSVRKNNRKAIRSYIYENSAIYHLLYTIYNRYISPHIFDIYGTKFDFSQFTWISVPLQKSYGDTLEENLKEYKKRLNILIDLTKEIGATPIFVTQTAGYYRINEDAVEGMNIYLQYDGAFINGIDNYNILMRYNQATMSVCKEREAICLDSANDLIWEQEDFLDLQHMSRSSMQKIGGYIFENMRGLYE